MLGFRKKTSTAVNCWDFANMSIFNKKNSSLDTITVGIVSDEGLTLETSASPFYLTLV